jgi:hypothetical protein
MAQSVTPGVDVGRHGAVIRWLLIDASEEKPGVVSRNRRTVHPAGYLKRNPSARNVFQAEAANDDEERPPEGDWVPDEDVAAEHAAAVTSATARGAMSRFMLRWTPHDVLVVPGGGGALRHSEAGPAAPTTAWGSTFVTTRGGST